MKNLLESFAIFLVGVLSLLIVYLIVQYNMIEDQMIEEIDYTVTEKKQVTTENYLESLEGYGEDVDVEVDATKESTANTVVVKSEENSDDLGDVVEDKSKSSYMKNLENYSEKVEDEKLDEAKPNAEDTSGEPQKLEHEEIVDEVGLAIDAALDDL